MLETLPKHSLPDLHSAAQQLDQPESPSIPSMHYRALLQVLYSLLLLVLLLVFDLPQQTWRLKDPKLKKC